MWSPFRSNSTGPDTAPWVGRRVYGSDGLGMAGGVTPWSRVLGQPGWSAPWSSKT